MPRIAIPKREDAPAESKPILDNVDKMLGFVPNLHRLMSISPNALSGWATLMGSLAKTLDVKTRDGIALAVSEADGCDYCLAAHSFIAGKPGQNPGGRNRAEQGGPLERPQASGCGCLRESAHRDARQSFRRPVCGGQGCGVDRRQHRRDDRADCPVPVDQLHEQCGADPDRFSRGQSREGNLTRGALLEEGALENPIVSTIPAAWCQARLRAGRGFGRHEGARRPHLAARAHEGACQRSTCG